MPSAEVAVCVDFGSTFTKAALVDLAAGRIVASASHPTTLPTPGGATDVLDGYDACLAALVEQDPRAAAAEVLACSSAGGGLRIAVVGNEELVTAEAGRRVALSSGGKVVAVLAESGRPPQGGGYDALRRTTPDVVLLTGGTDGGNAEALLAAARHLVATGWTGPGRGRRQRRGTRRGRRRPRRTCRTWSPTTSCRGSACWRPTRRAPRSARCSCPT